MTLVIIFFFDTDSRQTPLFTLNMTVLCQIVVNEYIPEVGNLGQSVMNRTQCLHTMRMRVDFDEKSDIFFAISLF